MKWTIIFPISLGLISVIFAKGQSNINSNNHITDSQDIRTYSLLLSYISTDTQDLKLAEAEHNSVSNIGDMKQLQLLNNVERAKLLFDLFPQEITPFCGFHQGHRGYDLP